MDYHWHIMETFNDEQGHINRVRWGYFVRDGAYMQEVLGELTSLPAEAQGQPANAISSDTLIQWVQNNLGSARIAEIHDEVNAKLAANKARDPH